METKVCLKCDSTKSVKEFRKNFVNSDGVNHYCKECSLMFPMVDLYCLGDRVCSKCNQPVQRVMFVTEGGSHRAYCRDCNNEYKKSSRKQRRLDKGCGAKVCLKCNVEKSIKQFRKTSQNSDRHNHFCMDCASKHPRLELIRIGTRICLHCHNEIPRTLFQLGNHGIRGKCNTCLCASRDKEKVRQANEKFRHKAGILPRKPKRPVEESVKVAKSIQVGVRMKISERLKTDQEFRQHWHERNNKYAAKLREKLHDNYILAQLHQGLGIPVRELRKRPDIGELMETKRLALTLKRACQNMETHGF